MKKPNLDPLAMYTNSYVFKVDLPSVNRTFWATYVLTEESSFKFLLPTFQQPNLTSFIS